jgi:hypothetical protein
MPRFLTVGAILLPLFVAGPAGAQSPAGLGGGGIISGIVQSRDGAPVPAATIAVRRSSDTVVVGASTTDSGGAFRVSGVVSGSYVVQVRRLGFRMATRTGVTIAPSAGPVDLGVIRLEPIAVALEGVAVKAARPPVGVLPDRNVYSARDVPVAAGGTVSDLLRSVPELEVSVDGRVTTGGATPRIHINGRPAPLQGEALARYLQQLPAERIERVEVISNPSARYEADGQGGIVNIVMRRGTGLGLSGSVALNAGTRNQQGGSGSINLQSGRLSLFGGASASLFGNRSRSSDLRQNLSTRPITYVQQDSRNRNAGDMTSATLGAEFQVRERGTLWTDLAIGRNTSDAQAFTAYTLLDQLRTPTQRFDRLNDSDGRGLFGSSSVGYRSADEEGRNGWSLELRHSVNGGDNRNESARYRLDPTGAALDLGPEMTLAGDAQDQRDLSLDASLSRGWGESGQVEAGYRGSWRRAASDFRTQLDAADTPATVDKLAGDFRNREMIHAAFVTASRRVGRFSLEAGIRGEQAAVRSALPLRNETFTTRYRSLFPSANVSTELGAGVQLRLSYSKRVERPEASILNPTTPALDPLNLQVGNPYLRPEYTHSLSLAVSRMGRAGMLQFAPYFRRTVGGWDQVRTVDTAGVSTVTWQNIATTAAYGGRVSASVRQLGPVSGLLSVSGYREVRDASNLDEDFSGSSTRFSASGTLGVRATSALNVQGFLHYMPARQVPQGRISAMVFSTLGARLRLWGGRGSVNLAVVDPFELQRFTFTTRDRTHVQIGSSAISARRATVSVSYGFGRPPESKRKPRSSEDAERDDRGGRRIR